MKLLLTNDDGVGYIGIEVLRDVLQSIYKNAEIWIVAPESDWSGRSHSVTLGKPIKMQQIADKTFAVSGSPVDCVMLALNFAVGRDVDLVISGINAGANIGTDKLYSGTIAAAMEAHLNNIPSIALSQAYEGLKVDSIKSCIQNSTSSPFFRKLLIEVINFSLNDCNAKTKRCTSINLPFSKDIRGAKVKSMGTHTLEFSFSKMSQEYYMIGSVDVKVFPDSDISDGYITITPLNPDWTEEHNLTHIENYLKQRIAI